MYVYIYTHKSYCKRVSAGPPLSTSEITIEVSPLWKWGLSRPPDMAIPNPKPGACKGHAHTQSDFLELTAYL